MIEEKLNILFDFATKSFEQIVEEVTGTAITPCSDFKITSKDVLSIIVGVSGEINGRILINASVECAKKLAVAMNFGDELDSPDELFVYLAEFANMCCGRTATHINDKFGKRVVWITPPAIFSANDLEIITPHISTQKQYYQCDWGNYILDIGYSDGSAYDEF